MTTAHSGSVSIYKGETSTLESFSFVPGAGFMGCAHKAVEISGNDSRDKGGGLAIHAMNHYCLETARVQ